MAPNSDELVNAIRHPEHLSERPLRAWPALIRRARREGLLGRIAYLLADRALLERVPAPARRHLEAARILAEKHRRDVLWEIRCIRTALEELRVPVVLLKGAAYALADLPPARGRIFGDIDILVPRDAIGQVEQALAEAGWQPSKVDRWDERFYREWMHEIPPMVHEYRNTLVDVHHTIVPLTSRVRLSPAMLIEAARPTSAEPRLLTLSPADMVAHSAAHLFNEGEFGRGLRDLVDLDALLRHFGSETGFWTSLVERARELDLETPVFYALRYTRRILATPIPEELIAASRLRRPGRAKCRLMDELFERVLLAGGSDSGRPSAGIARMALYIRGHWLRLPPHLLVPHLLRKAIIRRVGPA